MKEEKQFLQLNTEIFIDQENQQSQYFLYFQYSFVDNYYRHDCYCKNY